MFQGFASLLGDLAPSVPTPTPGTTDIDLDRLGPPPIMYGRDVRKPVIVESETGPATLPKSAADLKAKIQANGGALYVWSADASKSPELQIVKANPGTFKAEAVTSDPGTYKITLASGFDLAQYAPYIVIGVGGVILLSILKK